MNLKLGGAPVVRRPGGAVLSAPSAGSSGKFSPTSGCRSWPFGEPTIELGGHVPTGRDGRFELLKNAHSDTRAKAGCSHKAQLLQLVHFAATKSAIEFGLAGFLLMAIQALLHNVPLKRRTAVRPSKPR